MKRECLQKILSCFFVFCIALSFSISTFAAAFTGAYMTTEIDPVTGVPTTVIKDVNPSGQTFRGQNVIEMNAYNNAPTLTNNTFNGSTDINPDFTSITSSGNAYNGSVDINYDGLGGTLDSNGDRFQSTTVTAQQSDISISNGTFNGTTNINAQSVSLGSITQMDSLLDLMYIYYISMTEYAMSGTATSYNKTNPYTGHTVTIPLQPSNRNYITYSNNAITFRNDAFYATFMARFKWAISDIPLSIGAIGNLLIDKLDRQYNYMVGNSSYPMYTFTVDNETYSLTVSNRTVPFRDVIGNRLDTIINLLNWYCNKFFNWYYPLDSTLPEYWRYYNTDTTEQEEIGLAGLMYNISWYLGQMYVLQSASQSLDTMTDQVDAITDTLEEAEQKENAVISSISSGINNFAPDLSEIGAFKALSWTSNYLQQIFIALGTYGTVILVGLLLGVCMQFIGYFKYK